jgi:hypothetical protein
MSRLKIDIDELLIKLKYDIWVWYKVMNPKLVGLWRRSICNNFIKVVRLKHKQGWLWCYHEFDNSKHKWWM